MNIKSLTIAYRNVATSAIVTEDVFACKKKKKEYNQTISQVMQILSYLSHGT